MRIVISGVTGFLGSNLAKHFLASGFNVVGVKKGDSKTLRISEVLDHPNFSLVNVEEIDTIFHLPVDVVIHTATNYGRGNESMEAIELANVKLPESLWRMSQENRVGAFINTDTFMSGKTPQGDKYYNYVLTKKNFLKKAKNTLSLSATKFINMVVFHMYGPDDNPEKFLAAMARRMVANEPEIQLTSGQQTRDFVYISDVVSAFSLAIANYLKFSNFEEFKIGTGKANSIRQAVELLHKILNSQSHLAWGSIPSQQHDEIYGAADISGNGRLGWHAKVSLEEGLKETATYYKKNI